MAAAAQTRLCVATVGVILSAHWPAPARHFVDERLITRPNIWKVKLTRIAGGTVDPITGGATMKAIQDGLARWAGVPNERDPVWEWVEPIGQERQGWTVDAEGRRVAVTGVRIEVETLDRGPERRIRLESIAEHIARAKVVVKLAEGRRAAGKAAKRADSGEEKPARDIAACETCGAPAGAPCRRIGEERFVWGVHEPRARAAGLRVSKEDGAAGKPARAFRAAAHRKLATVPGQAVLVPRRCFVALPWEQVCGPCKVRDEPMVGCRICRGTGHGPLRLARWQAVEHGARERLPLEVPAEHRERWGRMVEMVRTERRVKGAAVWVYEMAPRAPRSE